MSDYLYQRGHITKKSIYSCLVIQQIWFVLDTSICNLLFLKGAY